MRRALRVVISGVAALAVFIALGVSLVYVATEPIVRRTYDEPLRRVVQPADPASIAEGRRLAIIRGCFDGCHGSAASGAEFWVEPWMARLIAPDLTRVVAELSDSQLERVIRRGVRSDGTSTWGMPSSMFHHLADEDLGRILAFLRTLPVALTVCTECHGMDLRGAQDGDRKLDLMALVARGRFSHLTDEEVRELYHYLLARSRKLP
jgi:cytochrome c553